MYFETWITTDQRKLPETIALHGNVFTQDNMANLIGVVLKNDGANVDIDGSVVGYAIRADKNTVIINGEKEGNRAWVILPEAAYAYPGPLSVVIRVVNGDDKTVIGAVSGYVTRSISGSPVDPGHVIPDITELLAIIEECEEAAGDANSAAALANTKAGLADTAATRANTAAAALEDMDATATTLTPGSSATATVSTVDGHYRVSLGIPQGAKGDKGDTGDIGPTPAFSIGTVETLEPSEDATATITGTAAAPVLNLGIPKGDTGEVTQQEFDALDDDVAALKSALGDISTDYLTFSNGYGINNNNLLSASNSCLSIDFSTGQNVTTDEYVFQASTGDSTRIEIGNGYVYLKIQNGAYFRERVTPNTRYKITFGMNGNIIFNGIAQSAITPGVKTDNTFIIGVRRTSSRTYPFTGKYYEITVAETNDLTALDAGTLSTGITHHYTMGSVEIANNVWKDTVGNANITLYDASAIITPLTSVIAELDEKLTTDIAELDERLTTDIAELDERLTTAEEDIDRLSGDGIVELNRDIQYIVESSSAYNGVLNTEKTQHRYLTLLHGTDHHADATNFARMQEYAKNFDIIDAVIVTGDVVLENGWSSTFETTYGDHYADAEKPCLFVQGNHDIFMPPSVSSYNGFPNTVAGFDARYISPYATFNGITQGNTGSGYWHKDFIDYKIRIIGINEYEMPRIQGDSESQWKYNPWNRYISQAQANWLVSMLNSIQSGWSVIILMHQLIDNITQYTNNKFNSPQGETSTDYMEAQDHIIQNIVDAFISKSTITKTYTNTVGASSSEIPDVTVNADFTSANGDFICYIGGHTHWDRIGQSSVATNKQVDVVLTTSGTTKQNYDDLYRVIGEKSQDCLNVYVFDTDKKKIRIIRVGANCTLNMTWRDIESVSYAQS